MIPIEVEPKRKRWRPRPRPLPKIFITYRITNTGPTTGRLSDHLEKKFGEQNVFQDVEGIHDGEDWSDEIEEALKTADVQLIVMGPGFAEVKDEAGTIRLSKERDWVAGEIRHGLDRIAAVKARTPNVHRLRVIPLLVDGETRKNFLKGPLPEPLKGLTDLQLREIRPDGDFPSDVDRLMDRIDPREYYLVGNIPKRTAAWICGALVALLTSIAVFVATRPPEKMGRFTYNVAVADFQSVDGAGKPVDSPLGHEVAKAMAARLASVQTKRLTSRPDTPYSVELRFWPRSAGRVTNDASAEDASDRIGADLLIYGTLIVRGARVTVGEPKLFYKSGKNRGLNADLIGMVDHAYKMQAGTRSFLFRADSPDVMAADLVSQTTSLSRVLAALNQLRRGQFDRAAAIASPVGTEPGWANGLAGNPERNALIGYISANAELNGSPDGRDLEARRNSAEQMLEQSLGADPTFTPSQLNLANIRYARAKQGPSCKAPSVDDPAPVDRDGLAAAFKSAEDLAKTNDSIGETTTKAAYLAGNIAQCQAWAGLRDFATAEFWFRKVVRDSETREGGIEEFAANARGRLGWIAATTRFDFVTAFKELDRAIAQMEVAEQERLIGTEIATGTELLNKARACLVQLETAIEHYRAGHSAEELDAFRVKSASDVC